MFISVTYYMVFAVVSFHLLLFAFDYILKICLFTKYMNFLQTFGLEVHAFQLRWFTTVFNRPVQKIGLYRPKLQTIWFDVGTWVSVLLIPFGILFILQSLYVLFIVWKWGIKSHDTEPILKPVFPGVNMPVDDIGYYIVTLAICTIYHELGHAVAAVREGIHLTGFGFIVMLIVPVCYVKLEGIELLPASKQLRIFCAGIWHNMILSALAISIMISVPTIMIPLYSHGSGVQVKSVFEESTLYGVGGLNKGDVITEINRCSVLDNYTWLKCIMQAIKDPVQGYCLNSEFVHNHDESVSVKLLPDGNAECCRKNSTTHLCFEYLERPNDPVELPQYSCLKARMVVYNAGGIICHSANDCDNLHCLRPSLDNTTRLVVIVGKMNNDVTLFLGHPIELYQNVKITEFVENTFLPSSIPEGIIKFCNFLIMISAAFAVLNAVPCFYLDGQHITLCLVNSYLSNIVKRKSIRLAIALSITIIGSLILVLYMILVILSTFSG